MSTVNVGIVTQTQIGDTAGSAGSLALRDGSGNLTGAVVTGTAGLATTGSYSGTVVAKTTSFTVGAAGTSSAATHYTVSVGAAATITFPLPSACTGQVWKILRTDNNTSFTVTLASVTGTTSMTSQYQKVDVFSDGATIWSV